MAALSAGDWIQLLGLAGLCGAAGQCVRSIVGLKKMYDTTAPAGGSVGDSLDLRRLTISIVIGAVAGMLSAMALDLSVAQITAQQVLTFMAAGYAGADFIEGFMSRYIPQGGPAATAVAGTTAAVAAVTVPAAPAQPG